MAVENLTGYTEVDSSSTVTVTSTKAEAANLTAFNYGLVYKDFGADYFNALDIDFEMYMSSSSGTNNTSIGVNLSNTGTPNATSIQQLTSPDASAFLYRYNSTYQVWLFRGSGTAFDNGAVSVNTLYYCTLSRTAASDTVTVYVYSNAARSTLVDTLSVSGYGTSTKWRYFYAFSNRKFDESNAQAYGYVQNVDLNIAAAPTFTPRVSFIM